MADSQPAAHPSAPDPTRVCHLVYSFYENDNRVTRYAETLAAHGVVVDVIALRRPDRAKKERVNGVTVHRIQKRSPNEGSPWISLIKTLLFLVRSSALLTRLQLVRKYDVVHVHNLPDFLVFSAWLPKLMGAHIILDIHDALPELYDSKFGSNQQSAAFKTLLLIERLSCRFANTVIVANHLWRERIVTRSAAAENCTTILNYPDLHIFRPLDTAKRAGAFVALYPGTLNQHQGVLVAVRAFARALDSMPGAEFHIYGEGPARPLIEAVIKECHLEERVYVRPPLALSQVPELMSRADVGIEPKSGTGFGEEALSTKVLEFMACGVPVIVSRTRIHDYYFGKQPIRFFAPGNEVELSDALIERYNRRSLREQERETLADFVRQNSWQAHAHEYLGIIDRAVAKPDEESGWMMWTRRFARWKMPLFHVARSLMLWVIGGDWDW